MMDKMIELMQSTDADAVVCQYGSQDEDYQNIKLHQFHILRT